MLTKTEFQKRKQPQRKVESTKVVEKPLQTSNDYLQVILVILLVIAAFALGMMYTKINLKEKQTSGVQNPSVNVPVANNPQAAAPQPTVDPSNVDKLTATDHIRGDKNARLQLIVYSDLECPFSKKFQTTIKQITDQYKNQIAIVYRHFPLDQIHSKIRKEAQATECAAKLAGNDGFWKLTDKIYETTTSNNGLDLASLPTLAAQVGINKATFQACLDSGEMAQTVETQYQSGVKAGVNGTPGSFLVDSKTGTVKFISGAQPFEQIKPIIEELLKS